MRKIEVIAAISKKTGVPKVDVRVALEFFFMEVKEAVTRGESVSIRNFGSFSPKKRAARRARHIQKDYKIFIPAHYVPKFTPSEKFLRDTRSIDFTFLNSLEHTLPEGGSIVN
jgi:DNA-binding protein HU-beta